MSDIIKYIKANKKMAIGLLVLVLITFGWVKFIGISPKSGPSIYAISTADSVISILDKMSEDEYLKIAIDKLSIFQSNQELEFKKLRRYIDNRVKSNDDSYGMSLLLITHGFECDERGESDSVQYYLDEAESLLPVGSDKSYYYHLKSVHLMGKREFRAAKELINKGLAEATKFNDLHVRSSLLNNLSTIYFYQSLFGAASKCFLEVYDNYPKDEPMPAVLINNIVSLKLAEKNYKAADEFWKKNEAIIEAAKDPYARGVLAINKLQINISLGRWDQSAALLSSMPDSTTLPEFRIEFLGCRLKQQMQVDASKVSAMVKSHMPWIADNYFKAISGINEFMEYSVMENPDLFDLDSLSIWHDRLRLQFKENPLASSNHYRLMAKILKSKDDPDKAYIALNQSMEFENQFLNFHDSLTKADFTAKKELEVLKNSQLEYQLELSNRKKISNYTYGLFASLGLILILTALFFWMKQRIKQRELAMANYQLSLQREEKSHIQKEKEMNERIIHMSELVLSKSMEISKKLKTIKTENPQELDSIRKDLEAMSRVENTTRPQLADSKIKEQGDIFDHYPALKTLSLTEKRIFILSVDGYKSKDIAAIVGITPQYIHNVRSKIRRILGIDNSIHWESFKEKS
jgi:DNA-binding CsgD family transcriptional regulator